MFTYLVSIIISIIIMNFMNFDQFTVLLGVVVGSFFYIIYIIEAFYEAETYMTFQVKEVKEDENDVSDK